MQPASGGLSNICIPTRGIARSGADRRFFHQQEHFPAYHCRDCDGYYTLLTGTAFAKTHQSPATLVLLLRGFAKNEPTTRQARELGLSRQMVHTLRQCAQDSRNETTRQELSGRFFESG